jgi:hypothetical protein
VEEAGANAAVHFHHCGDPRSIAGWSPGRRTLDAFAKASADPSQLRRAFRDEPPVNVVPMHLDQKLDLVFECDHLILTERNLVLAPGGPNLFPVEGSGGDVGSEERDAGETKRFCGSDGVPQMGMVQFLHCGAARDWDAWATREKARHTFLNRLKCPGDATNPVMHFGRPIDGEDDVVKGKGNDIRLLPQQESSSKQGDAKVQIAKELANGGQIAIEQRLASGEYNVLHAEPSYRFTMPFEIGSMELAAILSLPNVAHYTAAVALTV